MDPIERGMAMSNERENGTVCAGTSAGTVLLAVLGGAVLGAGIALLYAPQSGRRTRRKIMEMKEDAEEYARELMDKAGQGVEKMRDKGEAWMRHNESTTAGGGRKSSDHVSP